MDELRVMTVTGLVSIAIAAVWVVTVELWRARQRARLAVRHHRARYVSVGYTANVGGDGRVQDMRVTSAHIFAPRSEAAMLEIALVAHRGVVETRIETTGPGQATLHIRARWWARLPVVRGRVLRAVERAIEAQTPAGVQVRVVLTGKGRRAYG